MAFVHQKQKAQYETLRSLVKLDVDIDALDAQNKIDSDERAIASREAKAIRSRLAAEVEPPEGTPEKELDGSDIQRQLMEASQHNGKVDAAYAARQDHATKVGQVEARIENGRRLLAELEAHLAELKAEAFDSLPDRIDTAAVVEQLANISQINEHVRLRQRLADLAAAADERETEASRIAQVMADREKTKREAIERAKMPVEGLEFGDGVVLFGGVPLQQASMAEQIRVSVAIGMAGNPTLRVLHIRDGSLLDEDSLALITELATHHDYQVWMERVDSSGRVGIVFEDGIVIADHQDGPDITSYRVRKEPPPIPPPPPPRKPTVPGSVTPEGQDRFQSTDPEAENYVAF